MEKGTLVYFLKNYLINIIMNSLKKKLNQSLYTNNIMNNVNITLFFYYIPDSVYDSKNNCVLTE